MARINDSLKFSCIATTYRFYAEEINWFGWIEDNLCYNEKNMLECNTWLAGISDNLIVLRQRNEEDKICFVQLVSKSHWIEQNVYMCNEINPGRMSHVIGTSCFATAYSFYAEKKIVWVQLDSERHWIARHVYMCIGKMEECHVFGANRW